MQNPGEKHVLYPQAPAGYGDPSQVNLTNPGGRNYNKYRKYIDIKMVLGPGGGGIYKLLIWK